MDPITIAISALALAASIAGLWVAIWTARKTAFKRSGWTIATLPDGSRSVTNHTNEVALKVRVGATREVCGLYSSLSCGELGVGQSFVVTSGEAEDLDQTMFVVSWKRAGHWNRTHYASSEVLPPLKERIPAAWKVLTTNAGRHQNR